jgi:hypothetical protein
MPKYDLLNILMQLYENNLVTVYQVHTSVTSEINSSHVHGYAIQYCGQCTACEYCNIYQTGKLAPFQKSDVG